MKQERLENLLMTIDRMKITTVKQLSRVHDLGSYRNACRVVNQLQPYTVQKREREKIIYLNKEGRGLIGSEREVKFNSTVEHTLLSNEVYIYFNQPVDWKQENLIEIKTEEKPKGITFSLGNTIMKEKKKQIIPDATFTRNGYLHLIEVDNTRQMQDNLKKIKTYKEIWKDIHQKYKLPPILYFFTVSEIRKKKLVTALNGINAKVYTFDEIQ